MKTSRIPREENPYFLTGRRRKIFFSWFLPRRNSVGSSGGLMQRTTMNTNERQRTPMSNRRGMKRITALLSFCLTFVVVR